MPIGRIVLKSISESKKLSKVKTDGARLLYTWLIPHVDVNGCFSADPVVINGQVLTRLNKSLDTVKTYLDDLEENKLIIRYATDGDEFLIIPDFVDKQPSLRADREGKTTIPQPTPEQLRTNSGGTPAQVKLSKDKLSKDKIKVRPFVLLKEEETEKLIERIGDEKYEQAIDTLNDYKEAHGKEYKSDYGAINSWVIEKIEKEYQGAQYQEPVNRNDLRDNRSSEEIRRAIAARDEAIRKVLRK